MDRAAVGSAQAREVPDLARGVVAPKVDEGLVDALQHLDVIPVPNHVYEFVGHVEDVEPPL